MSNGESVFSSDPRNPRAPNIATCAQPNTLCIGSFNNEKVIRQPSSKYFISTKRITRFVNSEVWVAAVESNT